MVSDMLRLYCGSIELENVSPAREDTNTKEIAMGNLWKLAKDHVERDDEASYDAFVIAEDEFLKAYPDMMSFINEVNNFVRNSFRKETAVKVIDKKEETVVKVTVTDTTEYTTTFWNLFNNFKKNPTDDDFNKLCELLKSMRRNNEISLEDCNSMLIAINNVLENC